MMVDAYLLGLLSSDGYTSCHTSKKGIEHYTSILELAEKQVIEDICKVYSKDIHCRQRVIANKRREFWSVVFYHEDIGEYGKYLVKGRPHIKELYDDFSPDDKINFIRGIFDGDGSIVYKKNENNGTYRRTVGFSINSKQPDMKLILDDFAKTHNLILSSYFDKRGNGSWYLSFNGVKSLKYLYELFFNVHHSVKNNRKYNTFNMAYTSYDN